MFTLTSTAVSAALRTSAAPAAVAAATATSRALPALHLAVRRHYHEKVIDHYERPRNVGSLPKNDPNVGTGLVGAPACGDVMKLQIKVDDAGKIVDARFKTFGCGSAIASSSLVTEMIRGLSLEEAGQIKNSTIAKELSLPPVKLHCSMLAEDAIKAAISDFKRKRVVPPPSAASSATAPATA
ncbi:NifU-like N terminal domain-domain-containing protein [Catenaria anguillulae PL171]|uniref:Iron-sulfur cluster assembly protein n=1 Tax=Catenaria anguillulae PL171 TaxID=765915 RepID=A0A1Y2HCT1_9FUNG|nr:NifU-like N terminal domain-domain-containing protein [Catenaria anguillulae PL171]